MSDPKKRPIIIKKKVISHGGHHGGAWKVAYGDFVTAMMSLFIVLWLMNSNAKVKEAVAGYFRDPAGVGKMSGTDKDGRDKTIVPTAPPPPPLPAVALRKDNKDTKDSLEKRIAELQKALKALPEFETLKKNIVISATDEGIRIELMETVRGMFFDNGSTEPTKRGQDVIRAVAATIGKMPNRVMIEGHTDSTPFAGNAHYSNWQLSSERANAARMLMESAGMRQGQLFEIRGFADQQLRIPENPPDPSNRRISIVILNEPKSGPSPLSGGVGRSGRN
ncbi:MAG TPA: flagellar motor protein MotB [Bryobacteraceae bacterium]|nr:flagellar motor protein MotB [Bryobacteraceae bacterium]